MCAHEVPKHGLMAQNKEGAWIVCLSADITSTEQADRPVEEAAPSSSSATPAGTYAAVVRMNGSNQLPSLRVRINRHKANKYL